MPIWLRRFTFTKIKDFFEKKNEGSEVKKVSDEEREREYNDQLKKLEEELGV